MTDWPRVAARLGFAFFTVYLVVSVTFAVVVLTNDPNTAAVRWGVAAGGGDAAAQQAAVDAYREARNLDGPVLDRYLRWMTGVLTLDWGRSYNLGAPVTALIAERAPYTLSYLVPGVLVSVAVGVSGGVFAAFRHNSLVDRVVTSLAYLGFGVPSFWLALVFIVVVGPALGWNTEFSTAEGALSGENLRRYLLPTAVFATGLTAGQLQHARSQTVIHLNATFVRLLRAMGVGPRGTVKHVLRNAAVPLLTLFFSDLLGIVVVSVYVVEYVFGIPGLAMLSYDAIFNRDLPVLLGTTFIVVFVGVVSNLVQDMVYPLVDPRIEK
ncbi:MULTISPECIES: ABC transporter permease [Haloprofundus]|uniref:ABC transporter permease n=1 Tax=Haloprofundus TaxID=1911573 RepID=UPI000E443835|nr:MULTISPECIES: ABC transporter permease [Haloprofundus]QCJ48392.1 ABC transporter permease [Haloprofundus sp. MHR1]